MNASAQQDAYFEKLLKSCATFLDRWRGASAAMWELSVSHKSLRIVLTRPDAGSNLVLACLDPVTICGPVRWQNAEIAVARFPSPDSGEQGFVVRDATARVEIICGAVEVKENVKLDHAEN
jgi:hypothetical protein